MIAHETVAVIQTRAACVRAAVCCAATRCCRSEVIRIGSGAVRSWREWRRWQRSRSGDCCRCCNGKRAWIRQ